MKLRKINKRGQVTIFIIIALILVSAIIFLAYYSGWIKSETQSTKDPRKYIEGCMKDSLEKMDKKVVETNLNTNPDSKNYLLYEREKIFYLCTVSEFTKPCIAQDPAMFIRIRKDIENRVREDVENCLKRLYSDLKKENYEVSSTKGIVNVEILPGSVSARLNETIYISKGDVSESIQGFTAKHGTMLYELLKLTQTIVNYESTLCEFNKRNWMLNDNSIAIFTDRTSDQTKVYTLREKLHDREIKFAIKTCILPAGI